MMTARRPTPASPATSPNANGVDPSAVDHADLLRGLRVCIVTSNPLSSAPRVVKEADTLAEAGCHVLVVAPQTMRHLVAWDTALVATRSWDFQPVRFDPSDLEARLRRLWTGMRQRLFRGLARSLHSWRGIAEHAYARIASEQIRAIRRRSCDLLIAHTAQGLAAAGLVAHRFSLPLMFDAEDDHVGEFPEAQQQSLPVQLVRTIEQRYLPTCIAVTAASEGIADSIATRYGIARPIVISNAFPWSDREQLDGKILDRRGAGLSVYWYSQTIGLDRGIQDIIRASAYVTGDFCVHLRGALDDDVRQHLEGLAKSLGVETRLAFHRKVPPDELLSRAAEHDVGLALEQPVCSNKLIASPNKLLFYLLAGNAVIATNTHGHNSILQSCPGAGLVYDPGDIATLAAHLQLLHDDPTLLRQMKAAALTAARERWSWEHEKPRLLDTVRAACQKYQRTAGETFAHG